MTRPKHARDAMPKVAAWLDDLRAAFGRELVDAQIRAATTEGLPTFCASEGGRRVGVPLPASGGVGFTADQLVILVPKK